MNVYLDHAATTPLLEEVIDYFSVVLRDYPGNASSLHYEGLRARELYEESKEKIASLIGAKYDEIVFTSGGTESDNIAIFGSLKAIEKTNPDKRHVMTTPIEHEAVLESFKELEKRGYTVDYIPVDENGIVDLNWIEDHISNKTALCSVMLANNEVGVVEPVEEIAGFCRHNGVVFHTDAVQAMGKIEVDVQKLGVDLLAGSAHKFYGPKGVGFLYVREGLPIDPIVYGGGHEGGLRSGTENVTGAAAMAKALEMVVSTIEERSAQYQEWQKKILDICEEIGDYKLNGHREKRAPGSLSLSFKGVNGEALMAMLSQDGIAVSTASACQSHAHKKGASHVLKAMNCGKAYINGTIRVVMGHENTEEEIDYFCSKLKERVDFLRRIQNG